MGPLLALCLVLQIGLVHTDLDALGSEIERAVVVGEAATLERIRTRLVATVQRPAPSSLERYTLAYVNWRLRHLLGPNAASEARSLIDEAEAQLQRIIEADASHADALALLATIYGVRIADGGNPMQLGALATRRIAEAARASPTNPRVALLHGVHLLHAPRMFGGGQDLAEAELRRAEAIFQRHGADKRWPYWGHVDALAWLGQALVKKGDKAGARVVYEKALGLEPKHAWVRALLGKLEVPA